MKVKYDSYYGKNIPYKMTLEEMVKRQNKRGGRITIEDLLAYIRYKGEDVRFYAPCTATKTQVLARFLGIPKFFDSSDRNFKALCRIVTGEDDRRYNDYAYNPLVESGIIPQEGRWYCAYKLALTPTEFDGCIDSYYVSDFCSLVNDGIIEIWEV